MNQEMNEVPEYRQVENAPSRNSEVEAYNKGFKAGYREGNINGLKHACAQLRVNYDSLEELIEKVGKIEL